MGGSPEGVDLRENKMTMTHTENEADNRKKSSRPLSEDLTDKTMVSILVFLLLTTYSFNYIFKMGVNIYLSDLIVVSILALTLIDWMRETSPLWERKYTVLFSIIFLYYLLLVYYSYAIQGNSVSDVMGRFRALFFYPLLFFTGLRYVTGNRDGERLMRIVKLHVLISVTIGLIGLINPSFDIVKIFTRNETGVSSVKSMYFMVVGHGTALLCCLVFGWEMLAILANIRSGVRSFFFVIISIIGVIGSQNRSVLVVFLLTCVLIYLHTRKSEKAIKTKMRTVVLLLLLIMAGCFTIILNTPFYEKFEARINKTINTFSGENDFFNTITWIRVGRSVATYNEWLKNPVFGCGWGNQMTEFDIYDLDGNYVRTNYGTPHNYYITILYQTGIIGFVIMMSLLVGVYRKLKPKENLHRGNTAEYAFFIFYSVFLVFNIVNTHLYSHPVFIPVSFFLLGAAVSHKKIEHMGTH
jgi:O-antigen ligase